MRIGNYQSEIKNVSGGEGGIRTHGTVSRSQHFQCCQFNHSCTSPKRKDEGGRMKSAEILLLHLVLDAFHYSNKDLRKLDCFRLQRCQTSR